MSNHNFTIDSTGQEISVEPNEISAHGGIASPYLSVPLNLSLNPLGSHGSKKKTGFILLSVNAQITFHGFKFWTAETTRVLNISVGSEYGRTWGNPIHFALDRFKIEEIEKHRKDNVQFSLQLEFTYGRYAILPYPIAKEGGSGTHYIEDFHDVGTRLNIEVPHSHWVKKVLPGFGYQAFQLFEIPLASEIIPKEYEKSLNELIQAEKYFHGGDYDKTVSHCRAAIDPLKKKYRDLKKLLSSNSKSEWFEKISDSTITWLDAVLNETFSITSRTHHLPTMGNFSRQEAQSIYLITVGIVGFAGNIKTDK